MSQLVTHDLIVDTLHNVTQEVFATMLSLEVRPEKDYSEQQSAKVPRLERE